MEEKEPLLWPTATAVWRPMEENVRLLRAKVLAGEMTEVEATAMLGKSPMSAQGKIQAWMGRGKMDEKELWPTPTAQSSAHPNAVWTEKGRRLTKDGIDGRSMSLDDVVRLYPTPNTMDALPPKPLSSIIRYNQKARPGRKYLSMNLRESVVYGALGLDGQPLISSAGDSPASPSPQPGSNEDGLILALSGRRCSVLLKNSGPLGSLAKMLLASWPWDSTVRSLTWKPKATKQRRLYFQLCQWERPTSETESSLWPTPTARDYKGGNSRESIQRSLDAGKAGFLGQLPNAVMMWPTPDASQRGPRKGDLVVNETTVQRRGSGQKRGMDLETAVAARERGGQTTQLNPDWDELLMGFPLGWTDCADYRSGKGTGKAKRRESRAKSPTESTESKPSATPASPPKSIPYSDVLPI